MSHTDHSRPRRAWSAKAPEHSDDAPKRQPRHKVRRTGTRVGIIRNASKESA